MSTVLLVGLSQSTTSATSLNLSGLSVPAFSISLAPPSWQASLVDPRGVSMSVIGQSVASLVYLRVNVRATVNGTTPYNPTSDTVQFGFQNEATNASSVAPSSWLAGAWEVESIAGQTAYVAKILVGPSGTFTPTAATNYWTWISIQNSPEAPVMLLGELEVT